MARKTLDSKYHGSDTAQFRKRQLLCYKSDSKDIYYIGDPAQPDSQYPTSSTTDAPLLPPNNIAAPVNLGQATGKTSDARTATAIPDVDVTAAEIVRAIIAVTMKRPLSDSQLKNTLKELAAGRSIIQNEIIGDLSKEFMSLPPSPEDMPLGELCAAIQVTFNGKPGKHSQSLVSRMISAKMPGGFTNSVVRNYIEKTWGFGQGRQDGVLLEALKQQPEQRLPSETEGKAFLDNVTQSYIASTGLVMPTVSRSDEGTGAQIMVDPKALNDFKKEQLEMSFEKLKLYAKHCKTDLGAGAKLLVEATKMNDSLRAELDLWNDEHGEIYSSGISPMFTTMKVRTYDSYWSWALQDVLAIFYGLMTGEIKSVDREFLDQTIRIMNRSNPALIESIQYLLDSIPVSGAAISFPRLVLQSLLKGCENALKEPPVLKSLSLNTMPQTTIDYKGKISFAEIPRPVLFNDDEIFDVLLQNREETLSNSSFSSLSKDTLEGTPSPDVKSTRRSTASEISSDYELLPFVHIRKRRLNDWQFSEEWTSQYMDAIDQGAARGLSFQDSYVLLTGCGQGSIGAEILSGLLSGGAKVIVTTSSYSPKVLQNFQKLYATYGARGSRLIVAPFNQGSKRDVEDLISYIYDAKNGLGWDLDHIIPFAAISENGREIDSIDSKSELAHRVMLTNTLRLLGACKRAKFEKGITCRPAQVILPLSPNHGTFGSDGLYSESKLALEALFGKWHSENWSNYLSICGAVIGWTRGTNLMDSSDIVSEGIEKLGVRTFSQREMAFNILALMTSPMLRICQVEPMLADLNGRMSTLPDLKKHVTNIREDIMETSEIRRAITEEQAIEQTVISGKDLKPVTDPVRIMRRSNLTLQFPKLPDYKTEVAPLNAQLDSMLDLDKVVVVAGFAEVGPYGNSRTRWEIEAYGKFSVEGCIEMAWMMGLIKHHNGNLKGKPYCGWLDIKTGEPIADVDVKSKYESYILEHTGIRVTEPSHPDNVGSYSKQIFHEVVLQKDLDSFEVSEDTMNDFKREHGDKVEVTRVTGSGEFSVCLKKGATLMVPKALNIDPTVVGEIPKGWNAKVYGIDETIINQVDPVTLFALVCTVEALLSAGITDPYELYQYIHVSELGNCLGSGIGGGVSTAKIFKNRLMEKPVQNDILQESFINTTSAWINMLLFSSSGPIRTPVGACATSLESLDTGYELIVGGKAKVCLVGGFDHTVEEMSQEFSNMKATINVHKEFLRGRIASEMSRPTASSRDGFVESHGCGIQILTTAQVALDMGLPIHGVIALTTTASDKIGRSVPAPGKGILTVARETPSKFLSPLLNINYRKRRLELRKKEILEREELDLLYLEDEIRTLSRKGGSSEDLSEYKEERRRDILIETQQQVKAALNGFGNCFWQADQRISPLRGSLAIWGLTIDELDVASFHGTSTVMSEKNESDVIHRQLEHLNRKQGNAILGVFQKHLTGHPKGAAGAWMLNGCLQILDTGLVPGNRNADNVDTALQKYSDISFPNRSIQTGGIRACTVQSFGFGQKGAQAIVVHSRYLFAVIGEQAYAKYCDKLVARQKDASRMFQEGMLNNTMFRAKDKTPYGAGEDEMEYLMNSSARLPRANVEEIAD